MLSVISKSESASSPPVHSGVTAQRKLNLNLIHTCTTAEETPATTNQERNGGSGDNVTANSTAAVITTTQTMDHRFGQIGDGIDEDTEDADDAFSEDATMESEVVSSSATEFPRNLATKKQKQFTKLGTKGVGLKRVSFGSSKGSMVETLVFETPTPLSEYVAPPFGLDGHGTTSSASWHQPYAHQQYIYAQQQQQPPRSGSAAGSVSAVAIAHQNMDDSGIEVQEEVERSIVRVSIYDSNQPQQICHPSKFLTICGEDIFDPNAFNCSLNYCDDDLQMAATTIPGYDRQQSTDSGWDNPFRPGGDLSREADEIVSMIRGGKPITPTEENTTVNGSAQRDKNGHNVSNIGESVTKTSVSQNQQSHNGTKVSNSKEAATIVSTGEKGNGVTSLGQVSKEVVPGPTSASHVIIDERKNKKKGCCVVQ